jgi:hypothetical protein
MIHFGSLRHVPSLLQPLGAPLRHAPSLLQPVGAPLRHAPSLLQPPLRHAPSLLQHLDIAFSLFFTSARRL